MNIIILGAGSTAISVTEIIQSSKYLILWAMLVLTLKTKSLTTK